MDKMLFEEAELKEIKKFLNELGNHLPYNRLDSVWNWYKTISNSKEPKPCSCQSSAGLWVRYIDTISNWIKEYEKTTINEPNEGDNTTNSTAKEGKRGRASKKSK
jgi:hypothetical protein